jgi:hypothetical protein
LDETFGSVTAGVQVESMVELHARVGATIVHGYLECAFRRKYGLISPKDSPFFNPLE